MTKHRPDIFYKYMPANTAKLVLENSTLRWSSPLDFNYVFDVPRELAFTVKPSDIQKSIAMKLAKTILNPPENTDHLNAKIRLILQRTKTATKSQKQEIVESLNDTSVVDENLESEGLEMINDIWKNWIPEMRILCFCENHNKASMWYHYAQQYTGAVIELKANSESDSPWLEARKISYSDDLPYAFTPDGWAELTMLSQDKIGKTLYDTCIYTKTTDCAYENEWRISTYKRPSESGTHSD